MNQKTPQTESLHFSTKLAYGAGDLGAAITANILVFYLLYFFTNVAGLPAGLAGSILMIGKISDAINDPIVGILSDRTKSVWGRRIPWMFWGAIPFGLLNILQWVVPQFSENLNLNNWLLFAYYLLIGILFNIAYTAVNLPYTALTPELTQDYNERTRLNSFRFSFSIGGSILSLILAQVIFGQYQNQEIKAYWLLGLVCSLISVISIFWCTFRIQEKGTKPILKPQHRKYFGLGLISLALIILIYGISQFISGQGLNTLTFTCVIITILLGAFGFTLLDLKTEDHLLETKPNLTDNLTKEKEPEIPFIEQLKIAFRNKAFLYVIGLYLCSWLAVQLTASILIYFVVNWMKQPESAFPFIAILVQGTALLMLFVWKAISAKVGKKAVYFMGSGIWIVAQGGLFIIQPDQINFLYLLAVLAGFGVSVAYLIPWSMIPDVIELDELETGKRREGIFYGFMVLLQKFGLAFALFIVGIALELSGFIERIPGQPIPSEQPVSALLAIRMAIAPIPTIALIVGVILAYFYPITESVHQEIRLKLQARKENQTINDQET
jgi:glycoside/pentoside/hexuronide:cation symporter, GPH family